VFADRYDFEYVKFDGPIEIEIAGAGFLPVEIATFGSSAIDTLSILYPGSRYKIFYLEGRDIKESKRDIFAKLYDLFFAHSAAHSRTLGTLCAKKSALSGIRRPDYDPPVNGFGAQCAKKTATV
jgi:hypothetical protein